MSHLIEKEIKCPKCSFPTSAEIWSVINANADPELKNLLLGGEINIVKCESCREVFYADEFLIYLDKANELLAIVYPLSDMDKKNELEKSARENFASSQAGVAEFERIDYEPVVLFGVDELITLLRRDEEREIQSQIVVHLSQLHGFPIKKIRPSHARNLNFPRILPFSKDPSIPLRESILEGISLVLSLNENLNVFSDLREFLLKNEIISLPIIEE